MKKIFFMLPIFILVAIFSVGFISTSKVEKKVKAEINWIDIETAEKLAKKDGKKILVDVYTDWCGWCKKMDKATYENAEVVDYINKNYHAVKFNAEQREDVVVKGRTFKYVAQGRRGYHELAAGMLQGKLAYPATVFLDQNFDMLTNIPGYQPPKSMMAFLSYFKEELYTQQITLQSHLDNYGKSR